MSLLKNQNHNISHYTLLQKLKCRGWALATVQKLKHQKYLKFIKKFINLHLCKSYL